MTQDTKALIERLRETQKLYEDAGVSGSEGALQAGEAADALEAIQSKLDEALNQLDSETFTRERREARCRELHAQLEAAQKRIDELEAKGRMDQPVLAKDMKWPHCKGSLVPENTWNTGLEELMDVLFNACEQPWWCCDSDLKYLNLRIDTRDNAFILSIDGRGDNSPKIRIDPQRVVDAIAEWNTKFEPRTALTGGE